MTNAGTAVCVGIGVLLLVAAAALLLTAVVEFGVAIGEEEIGERTLHMPNELLLVLMIVELFHAVRVSLREHTPVPEPFLIVVSIILLRRFRPASS